MGGNKKGSNALALEPEKDGFNNLPVNSKIYSSYPNLSNTCSNFYQITLKPLDIFLKR
jgi:hypothetical protein